MLNSKTVYFDSSEEEFYNNFELIVGAKKDIYICANPYYQAHYKTHITTFSNFINSLWFPHYHKG